MEIKWNFDMGLTATYFKYSSRHARSPEFVARTMIMDTSLKHRLNEVGINCIQFYSELFDKIVFFENSLSNGKTTNCSFHVFVDFPDVQTMTLTQ